MKNYLSRIADDELKFKLESKGAVLIQGPKWCGKTSTALRQSKSVLYMQDPNLEAENIQLAQLDIFALLKGDVPRLIDEWQTAPRLWDAVRMTVDTRGEFGQFILTGSAVPADFSSVKHTGIGRISKLLMRPMSLYESGDSSGQVSLSELFNSTHDVSGITSTDLNRIAFLVCRGGWPQSVGTSDSVALAQAVDYYNAVVEDDISRASGVRRNSDRTRLVLKSYARNVGAQAKYEEMRKDIISNDTDTFDVETLKSYIDDLRKIFVLEDCPSWNPNLRSKAAIRTTDTRYFCDPSVAAAALGAGPGDLINDLNTLGLLFENMAMRDLRIYAESIDGEVRHYRDRNGLECDAVVHLHNGKYGLIEIKLGGENAIEAAVKTLTSLESIIDTEKMNAPSFKMVLTAVGRFAYKRPDGILVVPITVLKN